MFNALREKIFGSSSKSLAKSRLHLVLVQDRSGLSGDEMGDFRTDLLKVLQKYFVINDSGLEVSYQRESSSTTLVINSPVLRKKPTIVESNKDKVEEKEKKSEVKEGKKAEKVEAVPANS